MSKLIKFVLMILVFCSFEAQAYENERILKYHSDIEVLKNCDVLITETIIVYADNSEIKRGIYRELPLSYEYKGGNVKVGFEIKEVRRDGEIEPYHTEKMTNGIRIYIGNKEKYVSVGYHEYQVTYQVDHVLGLFDDFDEIYWNINGNGWEFTIEEISAEVHLPNGASLVRFDGYSGSYGSTAKDFKAVETENGVKYEGTKAYYEHENLTIAVAWDKNHLIYPTAFESFMYWLKSFMVWIISGIGLIVGFLFNYKTWKKHGKDPKPGVIIPLFYAPEGFSPAECAYLGNEGRTTNTMFGATLMSLATQKYLKIEAETTGTIFKQSRYTISKMEAPKSPKKELNPIEARFLKTFFGARDIVTIEKGTYNPGLQTVSSILNSSIDKKQNNIYFKRNTKLKSRQFLVPLVVAVLGGLSLFLFGGFIGILIGAVVGLFGMNAVFSRLYEQPTREGRKKMDEILGFGMYMKYADKERIKLLNPPTMNFTHFEENLAYAIALGIAEQWAGQFDPGELQDFRAGSMPYYHGMMFHNFNDFTQDLSSTISSASTPPSSSGSGSGGGGFSGGGGGGGGGGGW